MNADLRGLARHLGNLLAILGTLTLIVAGVIWLTGRDELDPDNGNVIIVLVVVGLQELVAWFALIYWADAADESA